MTSVAIAVAVLALATVSASAQTLEDLKNDPNNTDNVLTYGMGYSQHRYSTLKQIDKTTVKHLVPVWNLSLDNQWGEQAQPLVYNGVMYVTNAKDTVAIDVATGRQIWKTPVGWPPDTPRVVCCGVSNKGAAIYNGKVFRGTLDAFIIALDMKTGKEVWRQKAAEWKQGFSITVAPTIANGVLISGISGAEFGIRGFIDGWDPETGNHLWRRYTIPAPGEKGSDTWPAGDAYLHGGGSTWITGSYDSDLDVVYWGTGNAGPWNPSQRPGDNLYTASLLALRPKTGEIAWYYQFTPNDMFDYDANWEPILADMRIDGQMRKVVMQLNRNGFCYVLDRTNGKLLAANAYERVNWATGVDMKTGRPVESDVAKKAARRRADRTLADAAGRQELAPRRVQSGNRAALRQHPALRAPLPLHAHAALRRRLALHVCGEPAVHATRGRAHRPHGRDRSSDRKAALACAALGASAVVRDAGHRRRTAFHRRGDRRVHRRRRRHRQDRVAVPDRLGHQRAADHLHAQRKAIPHDPLWPGGTLLQSSARGAEERATGWIGVDLRAAGPVIRR